MGLIDRYVLRLYVKVILVCFVSLTGLYIVIDGFGNLDEFLSYGERDGGLLKVLGEYYGARVLTCFDMMSCLMSLIAAIFVITWMQRTNELTAVMAAGIPATRIIKPVVGAAIVVSLLGVLNREIMIPAARDKLTRNAQDWMGENSRPMRPQFDHKTDILIGGKYTKSRLKKIESPSFRLFRTLGTFGRQINAESAVYRPPQEDRPGGYLLSGVNQPEDLSQHASAGLKEGEEPVIFSPSDTEWLDRDQCFVASELEFNQLANGSSWLRYASAWELMRGFRNPSLYYAADARVEIHSRFVRPLLDVTLLFLGLPLVMSRRQRNVFLAAGLCLLLIVAYFLVVLGFRALGGSALVSPSLAAWGPLIVFAPAAYALAKPLWEAGKSDDVATDKDEELNDDGEFARIEP